MISFVNPGLIDIDAALIMGVNAKEGENPFGFFGTGLKYALATLLRNGCKVVIFRGKTSYIMSTIELVTRGKTYHQLTMNGEKLSFTTELGKTWKPWQAYRELYTNAKDEGGEVMTRDDLEPEEDHTYVVVDGTAIEQAHNERASFILEGEPDYSTATADLYLRPSKGIFYQGILVYSDESTLGLDRTWNIKSHVTLSEDRTAQYRFQLHDAISSAVDALADREERDVVESILCPGKEGFEADIDYNGVFNNAARSKGFVKIVSDLVKTRETDVVPHAKEAFKRLNRVEAPTPAEHELTPIQNHQFERAAEFCESLGFPVRKFPIVMCERLGDGVYGTAKNGTIYVSALAFEYGTKIVAATLMEEYVHLQEKLYDETRALQDFLFQRIISLGEEHVLREPL